MIKQIISNKINDLLKKNIIEIKLKGGLCNKLFCLFSACEIAKKNNFQILEPEFGWYNKILFSDIYDIDYFNVKMSEYFNGSLLMIPRKDFAINKNKLRVNYENLWKYSEKDLKHLRTNKIIYRNSMMVKVINSLKLKQSINQSINQSSGRSIQNRKRLGKIFAKENKQYR